MRQDRACPSDKCSTLLIQPLLLDNLLMCSTTRVLEDQAPKLRFVASQAQLLNFWCVFLISVTSHQNSFLLAIPVPFTAEIVGLRLLVFDFYIIFFSALLLLSVRWLLGIMKTLPSLKTGLNDLFEGVYLPYDSIAFLSWFTSVAS